MIELFSFDSEQLVAAFLAHIRALQGFEPGSERVPQVARKLLSQLCQSVLDGKLSVPDFCQTVSHIDANYVESGLRLPYPTGLNELWNGCDWCDEQWSIETEPHLRQVLEKHIAAADDDESAP